MITTITRRQVARIALPTSDEEHMREVYISSRFRTPKSATCLPVYFDKCAIRQYILFRTSRSSLFLDDQRTEVSGNVICILGKAKQWIPVHSAKTKREGAREIGSLQDGLRDVDTGSRKIGRGAYRYGHPPGDDSGGGTTRSATYRPTHVTAAIKRFRPSYSSSIRAPANPIRCN